MRGWRQRQPFSFPVILSVAKNLPQPKRCRSAKATKAGKRAAKAGTGVEKDWKKEEKEWN